MVRAAIRRGLQAAKDNLRPGLALWLVAVTVVTLYYASPRARTALDALAAFKQRWGYGFAVISTACWGGLVPPLLLRISIRSPERRPVLGGSTVAFLTLFWGYKGAEVNLLYEALAETVGTGTDITTVLTKVAIDQLLYGPLWAVPSLAVAFLWKEQGYALGRTLAALDRRFFETVALPMLLANWGVWIPTVAAIYALPLGLQLPMQNLALCLWSLMLAAMTSRTKTT